ncbi:MAG: DNA-directed RNA polymerase subunit delta [Candidatus Izemoplasmataceae bacterium]
MVEIKEQSLINLAEIILSEKKQPVDLYDLFDLVIERRGSSIDDLTELLNAFYADITSSAKFVYMGKNTWDLKKHQKIELWEKDGSYYDEYSEVEDPELDERIAKQVALEKAHQEMLEKRKIDEEKAIELKESEAALEEVAEVEATEVDVIDDTVLEALDEEFEEEIVEDEVEVVKTSEEALEEPAETEEVEEEYDEFDEEKYNEYMDTYEDEYDK